MSIVNYFLGLFSKQTDEKKVAKKKSPSFLEYLKDSCEFSKTNKTQLTIGIIKLEDRDFHHSLQFFLTKYFHSNNGRCQKDLIIGQEKLVYLLIHENAGKTKEMLEDFVQKTGYFYPEEETGKLKVRVTEYSPQESYKDFLKTAQSTEPIEYILKKK